MFIAVTTIRPSIHVAGPGRAAASAAPGADVLTSTARGLFVSYTPTDLIVGGDRVLAELHSTAGCA
jgi:hypothetical protein